jgi:WD40 repeat protein
MDGVHQAAFSPDERRILTVSFDGTARLWDASTADQIAKTLSTTGTFERAIGKNRQFWLGRKGCLLFRLWM